GPDDERKLAGLGLGATHRVPPDPERLDQGEGVEVGTGAREQGRGRYHEALAHAAVDGDAEQVERLATVGAPAATGEAPPARRVRQHGAVVARADVAHVA